MLENTQYPDAIPELLIPVLWLGLLYTPPVLEPIQTSMFSPGGNEEGGEGLSDLMGDYRESRAAVKKLAQLIYRVGVSDAAQRLPPLDDPETEVEKVDPAFTEGSQEVFDSVLVLGMPRSSELDSLKQHSGECVETVYGNRRADWDPFDGATGPPAKSLTWWEAGQRFPAVRADWEMRRMNFRPQKSTVELGNPLGWVRSEQLKTSRTPAVFLVDGWALRSEDVYKWLGEVFERCGDRRLLLHATPALPGGGAARDADIEQTVEPDPVMAARDGSGASPGGSDRSRPDPTAGAAGSDGAGAADPVHTFVNEMKLLPESGPPRYEKAPTYAYLHHAEMASLAVNLEHGLDQLRKYRVGGPGRSATVLAPEPSPNGGGTGA